MKTFLKCFVFGLIVLLIGIAIGFQVPLESVTYQLVTLQADKNSIWDSTGAGGLLGENDVVALTVKDAVPEKDPAAAGYFKKYLIAALEKQGINVANHYPNQLFVEIKNFSTKRPLSHFSIENSANEIAREVREKLT